MSVESLILRMITTPERTHAEGWRLKSLGPGPSQTTLEWLLEEENPSVRYFTLTGLLGRRADDPEVLLSKDAIMTDGPVPAIPHAPRLP